MANISLVAYIFSDPNRIAKEYIEISLKLADEYYETGQTQGQTAKTVWNVIMNVMKTYNTLQMLLSIRYHFN